MACFSPDAIEKDCFLIKTRLRGHTACFRGINYIKPYCPIMEVLLVAQITALAANVTASR